MKDKIIGVSFLRVFRNALTAQPDGHLFRRSVMNCILTFGGSFILAAIAWGILTWAGVTFDTPDVVKISILDLFEIVVFAASAETLLMIGLLALVPSRWGIVCRSVISAVVWGGLHALSTPFWFFGSVFGFFVFSYSYLVWRKKSFKYGFAAAAIPHALNNLIVFVIVAISRDLYNA